MQKGKDTSPNFNATLTMKTSSLSCEDIEKLIQITEEKVENQANSFFEVEESSTQTIILDKKLGEGGYGTVHVGKQNMPNREIAIKILHKDNPEERKRLLQEANIIGRLEHPSIVPIYEVFINEDDQIQIMMKKIKGTTLKEAVDELQEPEIRIKHGIESLIQVSHALEFAHSNFILHRDIKCENIMLGPFNEVYLMDWGLALDMKNKRRFTEKIVGTPSYLAPEMLSGDQTKLDERTDIYLLGATFHYILLQQSRHHAGTIGGVLDLARESKPFQYPDFIPQNLADIANKACAQNPDDRFQTALEFRKALEKSLIVWHALKLCEKAHDRMEFLKSLKLDAHFSEDDFHDINFNFARVLTTYETALELCNNFQAAQKGVEQVKNFMLHFCLAQNKPQQALTIYKQSSIEDPELETKIKIKINEKRSLKTKANTERSTPTFRKNHLVYATMVGMLSGATFYATFSNF